MAKYVIVPIVEGHGEVAAVPILLERWLRFRRYFNVEIDVAGPVRAAGQGALKVAHDGESELGIEYYIEIALRRRPDAIFVLLDADEDCPKVLAPNLLARARTMVPADYPIGVVIAKREYEAWFLAAFPSARFRRSLMGQGFRLERQSLPRGMDVEAVANCKDRIAGLIGLGKYEETVHRRALTHILPFAPGMTRRSRSFRKLLKELHELLMKARQRRSLAERRKARGGPRPPTIPP
jgi:Domain of unknown function (DUF4276)